jgi:hypothetical protein
LVPDCHSSILTLIAAAETLASQTIRATSARVNAGQLKFLIHFSGSNLDRDGDIAGEADEKQANAFAAELLLPEKWMRNFNWPALTRADVARFWRV